MGKYSLLKIESNLGSPVTSHFPLFPHDSICRACEFPMHASLWPIIGWKIEPSAMVGFCQVFLYSRIPSARIKIGMFVDS